MDNINNFKQIHFQFSINFLNQFDGFLHFQKQIFLPISILAVNKQVHALR